MSQKVSIIIGTFNRAVLLERCLNSVFGQTYKNIEVIVIDDCSSDSTHEVLSKYQRNYPDQFICFKNTRNKGIAFNSNLGFSMSSGDYIGLLGDDDYWIDEEKIANQVEVLEVTDSIGVVGTYWLERNGKTDVVRAPESPRNWTTALLAGGGIICGSTPLIRRSAWLAIDGFDESMRRGTDSDLFRRIILKGFEGSIIKKATTVVDVGHGELRMTPQKSLSSVRLSIKMEVYILKKYWKSFLFHPTAAVKRLIKIIKLLIKTGNLIWYGFKRAK